MRAKRALTYGVYAAYTPRAAGGMWSISGEVESAPQPPPVIVEAQPGASEQTGGRVAAPIARSVIAAALQ
jgi:hypothetical protein